jgi:dCMP deaminase
MDSKWHQRYMDLAKMIASWSKDPSTSVGAVAISDDNRILSTGYNGFPKGIADTEERLNDRETKYELTIHAELNVILTAAAHGVSLTGSSLFVHGLPVCSSCAKHIIQSGIKKVYINQDSVYNERWYNSWLKTEKLLAEASIEVFCL